MAVISDKRFSIHSTLLDLHGKAIRFFSKYVPARRLETVQKATICIGTALFSMGAMWNAPYNPLMSFKSGFIHLEIIFGAVVYSCEVYRRCIAIPFILKEMKKAVAASKGHSHSMLMVHSEDDWSKLSVDNYNELDYFQNSAKNYSIDQIEVETQSKWMNETQGKYDRIDIVAHANRQKMRLAPQLFISENSKEFLKWISGRIQKGGTITLKGCSAAEGEENFARVLSRACPESYVRAATEIIDITQGIHYNQEGIATFMDGSRNITRVYQNGRLV